MKYNKIAALIKKSKWLDVKTVDEGEQWVGDGSAMFPIYGMPQLDNEQIYKLLSLENDKTKISDGQAGMFDDSLFSEDYAGEIQVREFGVNALINGEEHQTLYTELGALLIKSKYIEIAADNVEIEGQLGIYIRKCGKIPFIAIKKGFALLSIAAPVYTWGAECEIFEKYRKLCEMHELTRINFGESEDGEYGI